MLGIYAGCYWLDDVSTNNFRLDDYDEFRLFRTGVATGKQQPAEKGKVTE